MKGFVVISRLTHIFIIVAMVLATNAACFCWMQMAADSGCHAVKEMPDCCCSQEAEVVNDLPEHNVAVLPAAFQMLDINMVVAVVDDLAFSTQEKSLSLAGHQSNRLLRSPPNLYVLHATFLI